jgi:hypothetical protein
MIKIVKLLPLFTLFLLLKMPCCAQEDESHYLPLTSHELQVGGGFTQLGFFLYADYGHKINRKMFVTMGLVMEKGKINEIDYTSYYLKPGLSYLVNHPEQKVHLLVAAGFLGAYSSLKETKDISADSKTSGMNVGGYVGPELEVMLSKSLLLNTHFHQAYLPLEFMGTAMYFAGAGLKFKF